MSLVTKKGQITIPKKFRDTLKIGEGDRVVFELHDKQLVLKKKKRKSILSVAGIAQNKKIGKGFSSGKEIIDGSNS